MELERLKKQIKLLEKAYVTLYKALQKDDLNELEEDGVIQRFEYTIELSRKTCKKFLDYKQVSFLSTPKDIFNEIFKLEIISDLQLWSDFINIRNSMSHIYSEYVSNDSFNFIKDNYLEIGNLIQELKNNV